MKEISDNTTFANILEESVGDGYADSIGVYASIGLGVVTCGLIVTVAILLIQRR